MTEWVGDLSLADLVLVVLPRKRTDAVTIRQLAAQVGRSRRDVEAALQELATRGVWAICAATSEPAGYWITNDAAELDAYIRSLQGRLVSQYRRVRALRRVAWYLRGQQQLRLPL